MPKAGGPPGVNCHNRSKIRRPAQYCVAFLDMPYATGSTLQRTDIG